MFGLRDDPESTRRLVAGLRNVIEDAEISGTLDATEKELISNVMEFRDVDVAAVMTPRTEIQAADVEQGILAAAQKLAGSGHSRVPVYEGTLDTIIGTVSARDLVAVIAAGKLESTELRAIVHTAYFVPETKHISELMSELRREKIELAIVLDEYGGTAGLVTMGDIVGEIVGELPDEYDEDAPAPVRPLPGGAAEVDATLHVTEVNEALDLDLPEEADYETLGGFVLATLGHFPHHGEHFTRGNAEFSVVEASDRRVLKVRVKKLAPSSAA
jgi:CBS domain containing-hemolysin-like protein